MAKTVKLKIKNAFADDTDRNLEFPINPETGIETVRTNVKAFDPADVANIYISEGSATCTGIVAATVLETEESEINLNINE